MPSERTCFLDESAVCRVARLQAEAHLVDSKGSEDVLIPHDEVRRNAVGSPVLLVDCKPLLYVEKKGGFSF